MGPRGHLGGVDVGSRLVPLHHPFGADQPFEGRRGREVGVAQEQPHVEVGTGLELDPARLAVVHEDGGQPTAPGVFADKLGGGPRDGIEARVEAGQFGPRGAPDDDSRGPGADRAADGIRCRSPVEQ